MLAFSSFFFLFGAIDTTLRGLVALAIRDVRAMLLKYFENVLLSGVAVEVLRKSKLKPCVLRYSDESKRVDFLSLTSSQQLHSFRSGMYHLSPKLILFLTR